MNIAVTNRRRDLLWIATDGSYGDSGISVLNTGSWSAEDFNVLEEMTDRERADFSVEAVCSAMFSDLYEVVTPTLYRERQNNHDEGSNK